MIEDEQPEPGTHRYERCIDACELAHEANGMWACPMFANVDKVSIMSPRMVLCRMFKRRRTHELG